MVSTAPSTATSSAGGSAPEERNTRLLLVLAVLGVVSAVVAGVVIFSSGSDPAAPAEPVAQVRAAGATLVVGPDTAPVRVVVHEDLGSPADRAFDIASRDFLQIEAAAGRVRVEHVPAPATLRGYSAEAWAALAAVMRTGTAREALAFHALLLDRQPGSPGAGSHQFIELAHEAGVRSPDVLAAVGAAGAQGAPVAPVVRAARVAAAKSGITSTPYVVLDGRHVTAATPEALADEVQRLVLGKG